jgi:hypothetical protein
MSAPRMTYKTLIDEMFRSSMCARSRPNQLYTYVFLSVDNCASPLSSKCCSSAAIKRESVSQFNSLSGTGKAISSHYISICQFLMQYAITRLNRVASMCRNRSVSIAALSRQYHRHVCGTVQRCARS